MFSRSVGGLLDLSVVGFGAFGIGGGRQWGRDAAVDKAVEDRILSAMRTAVESGINWIDTAEIYGSGRSERVVGKLLSECGDGVFVATKVAPSPEGSGLRPDEIRGAIRGSLRRLQREHIDLYQIHWPDPTIPIEESWGAMCELVAEGLVRCIGMTNVTASDVDVCSSLRRVDTVQLELSPIDTSNDRLIRWCLDRGVSCLTYSPLGSGVLGGLLTSATGLGDANLDENGGWDWLGEVFSNGRVRDFARLASSLGRCAQVVSLSLPQLVLAWNIRQPGVTSTIVGSGNDRHVLENSLAGSAHVPEEVLRDVDEIIRHWVDTCQRERIVER